MTVTPATYQSRHEIVHLDMAAGQVAGAGAGKRPAINDVTQI